MTESDKSYNFLDFFKHAEISKLKNINKSQFVTRLAFSSFFVWRNCTLETGVSAH